MWEFDQGGIFMHPELYWQMASCVWLMSVIRLHLLWKWREEEQQMENSCIDVQPTDYISVADVRGSKNMMDELETYYK
jgi:hypothetical protein